MNTISTLSIAIGLFLWCGWGVAALILRERGAYRVAAVPVVGLCSGVLLTLFLAQFGLKGVVIAPIALAFFGVVNGIAIRRRAFSLAEWKDALPVALISLFALLLSGWPLLRQGMEDYWGYANPDVAYYIPVIEYLYHHSFAVAPPEFLGSYTALGGKRALLAGYDSSAILGLSYFFPMLSLIIGKPASLLFSIFTTAAAWMIAPGVFVLCDFGLKLPRRTSLIATGLAACSAIIAYTLYLHSLGTMTVMAILPAGLAFALDYFRETRPHKVPAVVLITAGMYYDYFPGFAVLGLALGLSALTALLARRAQFRPVLILATSIVVTVAALSSSQALTVFRRLLSESFSSRLASKTDELFVTFALVLTERGIPFFWGLRLPFMTGLPPFDDAALGTTIALAIGAVFFGVLAIAVYRPWSGVRLEYFCAIGGLLALLVVYALTGNGYGAFKVVTWMHPLVIAGFTAGTMSVWQQLRGRRLKILSLAPLAVLGAYATLNVAHVLRLGFDSGDSSSQNSAPGLRLRDFRELQAVADRWGQEGVLIALPDATTLRWVVPFFLGAKAEFFPLIDLAVEDSTPLTSRGRPRDGYVLHWSADSQDLGGAPADRAIWRNRKFALTPLAECRDFLTFGLGWYRKEAIHGAPYEWQRHFRWLRKRGEVLILNPSAEPKRLLLSLTVGHGSDAPSRWVDLYSNGEQFDSVQITGHARVLTAPFVASGPLSQVEFAVRESAAPVTRKGALWNTWVPGDARQLNVALSEVRLVSASGAGAILESSMEFGSGKAVTGLVNGVYADGWVSEAADAVLRAPRSTAAVEIEGTIPGVSSLSFPYPLAISVDGVRLDSVNITKPGPFRVEAPLKGVRPAEGEAVRVSLGPLPTFTGRKEGMNADTRPISMAVKRIAFLKGAGQAASR